MDEPWLSNRPAVPLRTHRTVGWSLTGITAVVLCVVCQGRAEAAHQVMPIYGGEKAAGCAWPTTVYLEIGDGSLCTGTLVHPEVVISAGHCIDRDIHVWLGAEPFSDASRRIATRSCRAHPDFEDDTLRNDYGYCLLAEPVHDVPLVPILMGCETEALRAGKEVVIVGFGEDERGRVDIKRVATTEHRDIRDNTAYVGGDGIDTCQGDSGGPVFLRLTEDDGLPGTTDGSWRVYGITSWGEGCGNGGYYSMMHLAIEWFEESSGVDLTPCHDTDGTWAPGPDCRGFPLAPGDSNGAWPDCTNSTVGGYAATCGSPYDIVPPNVVVDGVTNGELVVLGESLQTVRIDVSVWAEDNDTGSGLSHVVPLLDGVAIDGLQPSQPPVTFAVELREGVYTFGAQAYDLAGNMGEAPPVEIEVSRYPSTVRGQLACNAAAPSLPLAAAAWLTLMALRRQRGRRQ